DQRLIKSKRHRLKSCHRLRKVIRHKELKTMGWMVITTTSDQRLNKSERHRLKSCHGLRKVVRHKELKTMGWMVCASDYVQIDGL
ncbi:unnamed protein product, partial [Arabidopsis halleri]